MDIDTIQTNPLRHLFDHLVEFDIFGADWLPEGDPIAMGMLGPMRAGNVLLTKWKPKADKMLMDRYEQLKKYSTGSGKYPIGYTEMLASTFVPTMKDLLAKKQINYKFIDGASTVGQLVQQGYLPLLFKPMNMTTADKAKQLNFGVDILYYHNSHLKYLAAWPMEKFLKEKFLFTEMIRKAIRQCISWRNGLYDSDLVRRLNISTFNNFSL